MFNIPNLDSLYAEVIAYVNEHQGEKGYIDCQPIQYINCQPVSKGDSIYCFVYNEEYLQGEENLVYGVRVKDGDLEICFEPITKTYGLEYGDDDFQNAEWYSVRWSDAVYYVPTLFNIAECIEEYD